MMSIQHMIRGHSKFATQMEYLRNSKRGDIIYLDIESTLPNGDPNEPIIDIQPGESRRKALRRIRKGNRK